MNVRRRLIRRWALVVPLAMAALTLVVSQAEAIAIDWVTVGDPGNVGQTLSDGNTGHPVGAVAKSFRIMKFEFTNAQYAAFLNAVDPQGTNPNEIYNIEMGRYHDTFPAITNTGTTDGSRYEVMPNMGDKPVSYVSWWDAARVANWLHNGQGSGSTETGAYTLNNAWFGETPAVAPNPGALFYIPTESEWHKAAFYNPTLDPGDPTIAPGGYHLYANGFSNTPGRVSCDQTGVGSAGSTGNFANYKKGAKWDVIEGDYVINGGYVTSVGTNGGANYYGAFDMSGNVMEWNDLDGLASWRGFKGGDWSSLNSYFLSFSYWQTSPASMESNILGFRLASPVSGPSSVPEIDPSGLRLAAAILVGALALRERSRSGG